MLVVYSLFGLFIRRLIGTIRNYATLASAGIPSIEVGGRPIVASVGALEPELRWTISSLFEYVACIMSPLIQNGA